MKGYYIYEATKGYGNRGDSSDHIHGCLRAPKLDELRQYTSEPSEELSMPEFSNDRSLHALA